MNGVLYRERKANFAGDQISYKDSAGRLKLDGPHFPAGHLWISTRESSRAEKERPVQDGRNRIARVTSRSSVDDAQRAIGQRQGAERFAVGHGVATKQFNSARGRMMFGESLRNAGNGHETSR